jgi:fucose 4-O-acetylase-like acetyltransferase
MAKSVGPPLDPPLDPAVNQSTDRVLVVDVARGIAILLIVVGHVWRGLAGSQVVDPLLPVYEELDTALYLIHIPAFFFLSGLFVVGSAQRHPAGRYLRDRVALLGWLYLVWTVLQGVAKVVSGNAANTPWEPADVVRQLWLADSQLWFLPTLLLFTVATVAVKPWQSKRRALLLLAAALMVSLWRWGDFGEYTTYKGWGVAIFFVAGVLIGKKQWAIWSRNSSLARLAFLVGGVGYLAILGWSDPAAPSEAFWPVTSISLILGITGTIAGLLALMGLSSLVQNLPLVARALALGGRWSLPIFLAHITFAALVRAILLRLEITDLTLHLLLGVTVGVAGSFLVGWLAQRRFFWWLLHYSASRLR